MTLSDHVMEDAEAKRIAQEEIDRIARLERRDVEFQDVEEELEETKLDLRRVEALVQPAHLALRWLDQIYPPATFTGVSGDIGVIEVVSIREGLRAILDPIVEAAPWLLSDEVLQ